MSPNSEAPRSPSAGKPTLEALLRLKRAERPDAAFWEDFDRGLRRKQLAAIIEPRPWWLGLSLLARRLVPVGLPVSATAAALLAVMVVRTQQPFAVSPSSVEFASVSNNRATAPVTAPASFAQPAPEVVASAALEPSAQNAAKEESAARELAYASATSPEAIVTAAAPATSAAVSAPEKVVVSLLDLAPAQPTPSQLTIAQNLAAVRAEEPALVASVEPALTPAPEPAVADSTEPVLKMEVFTPRHARVLLAMAENPEVEAPSGGIAPLRERMVHRLNNASTVYDSASRLGVGGDRFSVSF